jgi:hypothetical protein
MIKKRLKNHWNGLNNFEKLVNDYEIYPDGFAANFISIDRIKSIQEIIYQIETLLSMGNDVKEDLDLLDLEQEFNCLINSISEIQDDFQMHVEDLKLKFKKFQTNYESSKSCGIEIKESNFENKNKTFEENRVNTFEAFEFETLKEEEKIEVDSKLVVKIFLNDIDASDWQARAEFMCCDGFNLSYLNEKNKVLFFKIFFRLKNSSNIQFQEDRSADYFKITANLIKNPTFEEVGYLLEMRKYGLSIRIK